jgi:hypothetical protein
MVRFPAGARDFSLLHDVQASCGDHPATFISTKDWGLSLGVKLLGHEIAHLPPFSAEVKNTWIYTSTLLYVFMGGT